MALPTKIVPEWLRAPSLQPDPRFVGLLEEYRKLQEAFDTQQREARAAVCVARMLRWLDPLFRLEHDIQDRVSEMRWQIQRLQRQKRIARERQQHQEALRQAKKRERALNQVSPDMWSNCPCPHSVVDEAIEYNRTHQADPERVDELLAEFGL